MRLTISEHEKWDSTNYVFYSFQFLPDVKYLVVVYLKGRNGEESEPQSMTVTTLPRNETLQVSINGPTSGLADIDYVYSAAVSPCLESDNQAVKMEYKVIYKIPY